MHFHGHIGETNENRPFIPDLALCDTDFENTDVDEISAMVKHHFGDLPLVITPKSGNSQSSDELDSLSARHSHQMPDLSSGIKRALMIFIRGKLAEKQFDQSTQRLRPLVSSVNGILWEADAETFEFKYVSRQSIDIVGHTPEQWSTDDTFWQDHTHPEDREEAVSYYHLQTQQGEKRKKRFGNH